MEFQTTSPQGSQKMSHKPAQQNSKLAHKATSRFDPDGRSVEELDAVKALLEISKREVNFSNTKTIGASKPTKALSQDELVHNKFKRALAALDATLSREDPSRLRAVVPNWHENLKNVRKRKLQEDNLTRKHAAKYLPHLKQTRSEQDNDTSSDQSLARKKHKQESHHNQRKRKSAEATQPSSSDSSAVQVPGANDEASQKSSDLTSDQSRASKRQKVESNYNLRRSKTRQQVQSSIEASTELVPATTADPQPVLVVDQSNDQALIPQKEDQESSQNTRKRKVDEALEPANDTSSDNLSDTVENIAEQAADPLVEQASPQKKQRKYHFDVTCVNPRCPFAPHCENPRSCTLDYFGRNKGATNKLKRWPMMCRKCYQRISYKRTEWPRSKAELIKMSLGMIEDDEFEENPNNVVLYTVGLRSGEAQRLKKARKMGIDSYIAAAQAAGANKKHQNYDPYADEDVAQDVHVRSKSRSKKSNGPSYTTITKDHVDHPRFQRPEGQAYHKMPIRVLDELMTRFGGPHKSRRDISACLDWCLEQFDNGRIPDLPRFEATNEITWRQQVLGRTPAPSHAGDGDDEEA